MSNESFAYTFEDARFYLESMWDSFTNNTDPPKKFTFQKVFSTGDFKRAAYVSYDGAGPGMPQERKMLEPLGSSPYRKGDPLTVRPVYWGDKMAIPNELVRMLAKFGTGDAETMGQIASWAGYTKALKYNAWRRADLECLDILLSGTSTDARHVGRRSEPLFSTTHAGIGNPAASTSNLSINLSLTETNLNFVLNALMTQKDENGAPIDNSGGYMLVHGQALEQRAWTLLNTEKKTQSAENDKSWTYSMRDRITPVNWPEIPVDYTGWFVIGEKNGLKMLWMDEPYFTKEPKLDNNSIGYSMNMGMRAFWENWRHSYAVLPS